MFFGINICHFGIKNLSGINYIEGDATCLPFEDASFDYTISNTVAEHIAPEQFYGEQRRVLKEGGSCVVLSARKGIYIAAPCVTEDIRTEYITMINTNRRTALDNIDSLLLIASEIVTPDEVEKMKELTKTRYDRRIELYDSGLKQWDTNMSLTMMVKGTK